MIFLAKGRGVLEDYERQGTFQWYQADEEGSQEQVIRRANIYYQILRQQPLV